MPSQWKTVGKGKSIQVLNINNTLDSSMFFLQMGVFSFIFFSKLPKICIMMSNMWTIVWTKHMLYAIFFYAGVVHRLYDDLCEFVRWKTNKNKKVKMTKTSIETLIKSYKSYYGTFHHYLPFHFYSFLSVQTHINVI